MLKACLPVLALACVLRSTPATAAPPAALPGAGGPPAAIAARLAPDSIMGEWRCWRLSLDKAGVEADAGAIPGGGALAEAATLYALDAQDFDVSLRDLSSAGYWPYAFPAGTDLDQRVWRTSSTLLGCTALGDCWWLDNLGSSDWHAAAKGQILLHYAGALNSDLTLTSFATSYISATTGQPTAAAAGTQAAVLRSQAARAEQRTRDMAQAQPLPAFFTNPYTGEAMQERDAPGDYQVVALAKALPDGPTINAALNVRVLSGTLLPEARPVVSYTNGTFDDAYRTPTS